MPLPISPRRRRVITAGIMMGMFLGALESTVVGTAMPTVIASLGGLSIYSWVFSVYLLTSTVTVPIWGRLSDLYGRRTFYLSGIGLFLLGSILSGQSNSMLELILFRAVQGLGAGALVPLGLTVIGDMYTMVERARIQGLFSGVWGVASILGPVAGGFITDQLSWRWIFYLNVPFGLAAAIIIGIALREERSALRAPVDYLGVVTLTTSITLFMVALMQRGSSGFERGFWGLVLMMAASLLLLLLFLQIERRAQAPMLPLSLFANPIFRAASVNGLFSGMALFGSISFIPLFVQGVMGGSATQAGRVLTPLLLGWVTFAVVGGRALLRVGYRVTVFAGMFLLVAGFFGLARITALASQTYLTLDMLCIGAGMGLSMITLLIAVQSSVPRAELGIATSATQFFRTIGGTIGVSIMGAVLSSRLATQIQALSRAAATQDSSARLLELAHHPDVIIDPAARAAIPPEALSLFQGALDHALHAVFYIGLAVALFAFFSAFLVPSGKSHEHAGE